MKNPCRRLTVMRWASLCLVGAVGLGLQTPAFAEPPAAANPQIDYDGFLAKAVAVQPVRETRLLSWEEFAERARQDGALLLDARSERAFAQGHIAGAVNLPFSDFTDAALAAVIGDDPTRPIYIYCNNNFTDNRTPIVTKRVDVALNIQTFINLHAYGYTNVWELGEALPTSRIGADWVAGEGGEPATLAP